MYKLKVINKDEINYPEQLLNIKKAPEKLYVLGNERLLNKKSIAIIGSRDCTKYGFEQAVRFSKEIAKSNICIISGMAVGIDYAAHIGAMQESGRTIAVLGAGFDNIFPKENEELFYNILKNNGCIISEYPPKTEVNMKNFPKRNRIISALSSGVLVVEAKARSGTSITAKYALEQGKEVFCIPSNLQSVNGVGTAKLIQNGAKLVLKPKEVLESIGIEFYEEKNERVKTINVDKRYKEIYNAICKIPITTNEICKKTNKSIIEVNSALTILELQGVIKAVGINEFIKN